MKKIIKGVKSVFRYFLINIFYGGRVRIGLISLTENRLSLEVDKTSQIIIGNHLMSKGPLYLKSINGGILEIGKDVFFNHNCCITCSKMITIGEGCMFANNLVIVDHNHLVDSNEGVKGTLNCNEIKIGKNVWCGANVTILSGVTIGNGAVIAAGSVVNKDIPEHELWGGVPIKFIKKM